MTFILNKSTSIYPYDTDTYIDTYIHYRQNTLIFFKIADGFFPISESNNGLELTLVIVLPHRVSYLVMTSKLHE